MAGPEYDFFATGPRPQPTGPATDRFGMPAVPQPPVQQHFAPEQSAPMQAAPAVNQFGLPVEEARPTGPLAAPGYGAVPLHNSLAAGYDDAPSVWDPTAALAAHTQGRTRAIAADVRPGSVLAAGIISIVLGVLGALAGAFVLLGYLAAKSELEAALAASPEVDGLDGFASALLTGVLVVGVVLLAMSALYIVLGSMTIRGRRWAGWTLVVLSALSVLGSLWQTLGGNGSGGASGLGAWVGIAASATVLLLLTIGDGGRWLRRA
jgi:hypothetical protein